MNRRWLLSSILVVAGCDGLPQSPDFVADSEGCEAPPTLVFSIGRGNGGNGDIGTTSLAFEATIAPPIEADGSSVFELNSTIPVKIRVRDCEGARANDLAPVLAMAQIDENGKVVADVQVIRSSSEVDQGATLRNEGSGQYLYNLSTKLSGFVAEGDLTPGRYRLTISGGGDFADVVVELTLK
ncbi:MAG: hypothetical protein ACT4PM_02880 [Gemmatimonadales bacterium]